ncbi:Hypothetical_protein [Hexamita inflata]|uniref:Hypothetical_protein n=1 Tax=Hexamita inflata TaxID=28002 RepID=A0AA86QQ64_9EUKA|nr:Hypothetical protein HINF_LOCUS51561 [Hexamita inflata]
MSLITIIIHNSIALGMNAVTIASVVLLLYDVKYSVFTHLKYNLVSGIGQTLPCCLIVQFYFLRILLLLNSSAIVIMEHQKCDLQLIVKFTKKNQPDFKPEHNRVISYFVTSQTPI